MTSELVERLRQLELRITMGANEACGQAADEIERLTAQLAEARQAERAAVVAWLRGDDESDWFDPDCADAIEAGDHLA